MSSPRRIRSRRLMTILLVILAITLTIGALLFVIHEAGPQPVTLVISEPAGEQVFYDVVIDDVATSGEAIAPKTLNYRGHDFSFAVIPKRPTSVVSVQLETRSTTWLETHPGVSGGFHHTVAKTRYTVGAMSEKHVQTMRNSRVSADIRRD